MNLRNDKKLLPLQTANLLRIIFELLVLIHHLYSTQTPTGSALSSIIGPAAVAGFLLLSGYGVAISFMKSGDSYLSQLLKKRIPSTYLQILTVDILYFTLYYLTGNKFDTAIGAISSILYLPVFKGYVALSHWVYFLADLLIYYVIFFILMKLLKKKKNRLELTAKINLIICAVIIIVLTIINSTTGSSRYLRGCWLFPCGILLACYEKQIVKFLNDYKFVVLGVLAFLFVTLSATLYDVQIAREYVICAISTFLAITITFTFNVEPKAKFVSFLSDHVLFVYLSHEYFFKLFGHFFNSTWSSNAIMIITLIFTLAFANYCYNTKLMRKQAKQQAKSK